MSLTLDLGCTSMGIPVQWCRSDNPHLSILGRSGSGKSYFLRGFIQQAAQQGALCLVLDYSADFRDFSASDGLPFRRIDVTSLDFNINPLAASAARGGLAAAQQLLSALHSAFRMGSRANVALQTATLAYLSQSNNPTLPGLLHYVNAAEKKSRGLFAAVEPLELLSTLIHCGDRPISIDMEETGIVALGFDQVVDSKFRTLLVELILQAVWNQWISAGHSASHPLILVLDECQNLAWGESSMAVRILREGRKFGIGGWFASQWISNKTAVAALGQAALQANFRPEDANIAALAKRLAQSEGTVSQWQGLIRKLKVGQFLCSRQDGKTILVNVPSHQ